MSAVNCIVTGRAIAEKLCAFHCEIEENRWKSWFAALPKFIMLLGNKACLNDFIFRYNVVQLGCPRDRVSTLQCSNLSNSHVTMCHALLTPSSSLWKCHVIKRQPSFFMKSDFVFSSINYCMSVGGFAERPFCNYFSLISTFKLNIIVAGIPHV